MINLTLTYKKLIMWDRFETKVPASYIHEDTLIWRSNSFIESWKLTSIEQSANRLKMEILWNEANSVQIVFKNPYEMAEIPWQSIYTHWVYIKKFGWSKTIYINLWMHVTVANILSSVEHELMHPLTWFNIGDEYEHMEVLAMRLLRKHRHHFIWKNIQAWIASIKREYFWNRSHQQQIAYIRNNYNTLSKRGKADIAWLLYEAWKPVNKNYLIQHITQLINTQNQNYNLQQEITNQHLIVKSPHTLLETYTVKPWDTLFWIARKLNISATTLTSRYKAWIVAWQPLSNFKK